MIIEAYVVPGVACTLLLGLLSGSSRLKNAALGFGNLKLKIGSRREIRLSVLFLLLISLRWALELMTLASRRGHFDFLLGASEQLPLDERIRGAAWRAERNSWMCTLGVLLWLMVLRLSALVQYHDDKIKREKLALERAIREATKTQPSPGLSNLTKDSNTECPSRKRH